MTEREGGLTAFRTGRTAVGVAIALLVGSKECRWGGDGRVVLEERVGGGEAKVSHRGNEEGGFEHSGEFWVFRD